MSDTIVMAYGVPPVGETQEPHEYEYKKYLKDIERLVDLTVGPPTLKDQVIADLLRRLQIAEEYIMQLDERITELEEGYLLVGGDMESCGVSDWMVGMTPTLTKK